MVVLQDILRAYGATVTGKKGDLVARVQEVQLRRRDTVIELSEGSDDDCGGPAQVPLRPLPRLPFLITLPSPH